VGLGQLGVPFHAVALPRPRSQGVRLLAVLVAPPASQAHPQTPAVPWSLPGVRGWVNNPVMRHVPDTEGGLRVDGQEVLRQEPVIRPSGPRMDRVGVANEPISRGLRLQRRRDRARP